MRPLAVLLLFPAALQAQWGKDIHPGMGPQLMRLVEEDLAAIVRARAADRPALIAKVAQTHGDGRIEALKRFRDPELKPLFLALLGHDNWQVQHRALFALEYYGDASVVSPAWKLLQHPHRRLREKAAITCIKLWRGGEPPGDIEALLRGERDFYVRRCLEALRLRLSGKLTVERVHEEQLEKTKRGLWVTPFVSGLKVRPKGVSHGGRHGARGLPAAARWCYPLLAYGEEVVEGTSLQPFANLRQEGTVYHVGTDVGASLDGAGYYAAAEGVVMFVHSGSDMGTLLVVQHPLGGRQLINAVYMHGGDTVFVGAGDRVVCGQLLGTIGMGFSVENGGHFAHLHYGLYPGPFRTTHNYGYSKVKHGLADWRDPEKFLAGWVERTKPLIDELPVLGPKAARIAALAEKGEYARAYGEAQRLQNAEEVGSEAYVDANMVAHLVKRVPKTAVGRAKKLVEAGYPNEAARQLKELAPRCKGIPGAETLGETLLEWQADPLFRKALRGEGRIEATAARAQNMRDQKMVRALWEGLLRDYGDTCLAGRIREFLAE